MTRWVNSLLWLAAFAVCWSPVRGRADCSRLDLLVDEAKGLAGNVHPKAADVIVWTQAVASAERDCNETDRVEAFHRDPAVSALLGMRTKQKTHRPPGSGSAPPVAAPSKNEKPSIIIRDTGEQLELVRARLIVHVRFAVQQCGQVERCDARAPAIQAARDYIKLLNEPKVNDERFAEFVDALSVLGSPLAGVPLDELEGALVLAGRLSSMTPQQAETRDLPDDVRQIMKEPPSPQRTQKLLDALLKVAKESAQRGQSPELAPFAEGLGAVRDIERRIKTGEVRSLLLDVSGVLARRGAECPLQERVWTSAKEYLTQSLNSPPLHKPGECPPAGCDIDFAFRVDACEEPSVGGAQDCLRLRLRMGGATSDRIGARLPAERCIDKEFVNGLVEQALDAFERAMRAQNAWSGATFVPKGGIQVVDMGGGANLPASVLGTGIRLLPSNDAQARMAEALEKTFGAVAHRGTGEASPRSTRAQVALRWGLVEQGSGDVERLRVSLSNEAQHKPATLLEFEVRGQGLSEVSPEVLASHVTARVVRYYEQQEPGLARECQARLQSWYYAVLLAGLRDANDCDLENDGGARTAMLIDGMAMGSAALAGFLGFTARNAFSAGKGDGWLVASKALYVTAMAGLGASVTVKVVAW